MNQEKTKLKQNSIEKHYIPCHENVKYAMIHHTEISERKLKLMDFK